MPFLSYPHFLTLFKQSRTINNDITESDLENPAPLQPVNPEQKQTSTNDMEKMCFNLAEHQTENYNFALSFWIRWKMIIIKLM